MNRIHRDYHISETVGFDLGDGVVRFGEVIGIASENSYFKMYIILLDEPIKHPEHPNEKPWRGLVVSGAQLKSKWDVMA